MSTQKPSLPDPFLLALSRKLVLLILLVITSAIGLVALLRQTRISIPILAFLLTDGIMGLIAGFSVRWILSKKYLVLRIVVIVACIIGGLVLLGWFTGWSFGIDQFNAGHKWVDWWDLGQVVLATGFAMLALFAWQHPAHAESPASPRTKNKKKVLHTRRKSQRPPDQSPRPQPAPSVSSEPRHTPPQENSRPPIKPKRNPAAHSKPKLVLSGQEEHRCPYCLELIEPNDPRGVVECEICHTLHHADCWAITGACQVPHFTA